MAARKSSSEYLAAKRDQLFANVLPHAVKAESQVHFWETPRTADHGVGNADGGDEDAARRVMEQFGREQGGDRFVNGFFVVKRLAHAHEDDVSNAAILGSHALAGEHDLIENLGCRQALGDSHLAGCTKAACRCAANLRRQAERHAAGAGSHDDRFDRVASLRSQHELRRAVELRIEALGQHQRVKLDATGKFGSHICRQLGECFVDAARLFEVRRAQRTQPPRVELQLGPQPIDGRRIVDADAAHSSIVLLPAPGISAA